MKIVQINTFPNKATGTIMFGIHKMLLQEGHESYVVWGRGRKSEDNNEIVIEDALGIKFHGFYTRMFDKTGFASWSATKKLLHILDEINPDIIHLHNIHGYYLNVEILFEYIKKRNIKVVWTLHDCWPVTGHCAYFDLIKCQKWKTGCHDCEQKMTYPKSMFLDSSIWNWKKKRELFTGLEIHIVTPSKWLKRIVLESYLKEYPISIINNGIDLNTFKRIYKDESRKKYSPDGKPIVLGVASEWTERKGLSDFVELSKRNQDIQFVVVGVTKEQMMNFPKSLLGVSRTNNVNELVELYSIADVFYNPTYEDNFPTTNLEALACGTPVVTYDTGGSPECIDAALNNTGRIVGKIIYKKSSNEVDYSYVLEELEKMIKMVGTSRTEKNIRNDCREAALEYDRNKRFAEYISLYHKICI